MNKWLQRNKTRHPVHPYIATKEAHTHTRTKKHFAKAYHDSLYSKEDGMGISNAHLQMFFFKKWQRNNETIPNL